jgi:hypothetical protein
MITIDTGGYSSMIQAADGIAQSDFEFFLLVQYANYIYELNGGIPSQLEMKK